MERDIDTRQSALRQELLQSGLTLGMNSSATENRRKEESSRPADAIFSLSSSSLKSRLGEGRLGSFGGDKGDVAVGEKASRREAESMSDDRRSTNTTLQYDPRVDAVRAVSQLSLQKEGSSLTLQGSSAQNRALFRPGNMLQRTAHSGLPTNSHNNDALQKPFSKDPSPKPQESPVASPKRHILEHGPQTGSQQNLKLGGQRRRTPNLREGKGMMPAGSPQQPALQRQAPYQQVLDARESKGIMPSGSTQQLLQQQALHQQILDSRESKNLMSAGSPQQQNLQQQVFHQQVVDARESKGMMSGRSTQQQAMQQALHQQGRHQQALDPRENKGGILPGSPQQQALQQHATLQHQALQMRALQQRGFDGRDSKGMILSSGLQQQALQQQPLQQARHQQVLDPRESKGMISVGSPPQQALQQQVALHQQARHQQLSGASLPVKVLDARESKGMIPTGSPQQQILQQQPGLDPTTKQQEVRHQQVLDSRDNNKGMMSVGSPQQQALQQIQHQAIHQQALDSRDSKVMISSGNSQQQALQQQALQNQALDARESKGLIPSGSPQQQALQHQSSLQQQAIHQHGVQQQQVLDTRESKGMVPAGSPQQQALQPQSTLQQQAAHQLVLEGRESKGMINTGISQQQTSLQQQALHQHAVHQQVLDVRESNGMTPVGSAQQQTLQQQAIPQQAILHQKRHQQLLDARESKAMAPFGSSQGQVLHAFHQQALHQQQLQQGSHQSPASLPAQALLPNEYKGGYPSQRLGSLHLRGAYLASQPKVEPVELEGTASAERSVQDKSSPAEKSLPTDSASPKESVSVAETEEAVEFGLKRMKTEESKPSLSLGSAAESKDSVRSGSHREGGERDGRHPQSQSSGRTSRETMFADLNAEPPASDGEDDGPVPSDGVQMVAQPESSRTTTEEKRKRKKAIKDTKSGKEGDEVDNKKAIKPAKSRAKPKGEVMVDSGVEGDGDNHLSGVPTTKEEKTKSLKEGLVNVARKLPKNAHAHFSLGLMHQRGGHYQHAVQAFRQAAEILKQSKEETGLSRGELLATVQVHQAQCLLQGSFEGHLGPGTELEKEELQNVVSRLKEATLLDVGQASVWSTLGLLLLRSGRIQSAIHVLTSLLEIVPDQVDTLANLGVAYLHSGDLEHATRCFQSVLDKDKSHPGALMNYAALLLRQYGSSFSGAGAGAGPGAYATRVTAARAAQQCLEAALKEDPKAAPIWANLAAAYSTLGNIGQASQCLEQAAKLEPARMSTRYTVAAHRVKDAERSEDANEQLGWAANEMASILREGDFTSIQPRLAWGGLAMVNRAQHETAAAFEGGGVDLKEVEERALHTLQQVDLLDLMSEVLNNTKRLVTGNSAPSIIKLPIKAIEEDPADAVQWHQMGLHTLCTLQFRAAQDYLKTAIARRWANPSAWSNLGIALQLSEDPSLAEGVYNQALAITPEERAHTMLSNLGNLYRQQRRFSEAHEMYKRALDLCPDYAPACNNLGLLLISEGKWDDAIATFDRSLDADPYLDVAKSNKMKAVALAQMRRAEALGAAPVTSLPSEATVVHGVSDTVSPPVEIAPIQDSGLAVPNPGPVEPIEREPFPLPSIS